MDSPLCDEDEQFEEGRRYTGAGQGYRTENCHRSGSLSKEMNSV
uniref:Uncharacterized protein n=1 Tax=Nelumbo nucifera TaxID=4432 RepID=A0A822ZRH3_NELNU|nr:TPA_asm: hypothetical protein HUJ06_017424 [Nelumbo nucifera]